MKERKREGAFLAQSPKHWNQGLESGWAVASAAA